MSNPERDSSDDDSTNVGNDIQYFKESARKIPLLDELEPYSIGTGYQAKHNGVAQVLPLSFVQTPMHKPREHTVSERMPDLVDGQAWRW